MKPIRQCLMIVCMIAISVPWAESATTSQIVCSLGTSEGYNPALDSAPTAHALSIARQVANVLCSGQCSVLFRSNPTASNALTLVGPRGDAKVVYEPGFMQQIEKEFGASASFGILAHETGHVLDGRTRVSWMLDSWSRELRADAWAGCALARAGLSTSEMGEALRAIAEYPSPSHPAWNLRIPALKAGYYQCGGRGSFRNW